MALTSVGQNRMGYKMLVPSNDVRAFGYHIRTGVSLGSPMGLDISGEQQVHITTAYQVNTQTRVKAAPLIGAGVKIAATRGMFRYYAFEIDYLRIHAIEDLTALRLPGSDQAFPDQISVRGTSRQGRLSLRFSPQFLVPLSKNGFLHFGPGANIQSSLHKKEDYEVPFLDIAQTSAGRGDRFQLDADIGLATRMGRAGFLDLGYRRSFISIDETGSVLENIFNGQVRMHWITLGYHWMSKRADRQCIDHSSGSKSGARFSPSKRIRVNPW